MDLDDLGRFQKMDRSGLLSQIDAIPEQLHQAFQWGSQQSLPAWQPVSQIVFAGIGLPVLGAELMAVWAQNHCLTPLSVWRNFELPAWAGGPDVLVVICSLSGEEPVAIASLTQAVERHCRCLVFTTGGKLADLAGQAGVPVWVYRHTGPAMSGMGWFYGLPLSALAKLDVLDHRAGELQEVVSALQRQQAKIRAEVPVVHNPAKRLAGQLMNRIITIIAADELAPVARYWKSQLNLISKVWSHFDFVPEADETSLAGILNPENDLRRLMVIFLNAASNRPGNLLRLDLTRQSLMLEGIGTDFYRASGESAISQQWTAIQFGDYLAYYLAMAYGVDPANLSPIEAFHRSLPEG